MMEQQTHLQTISITQGWRIDFGLWLRNTPSQKNKMRDQKTLEAYERDVRLMAAWFENQYQVEFEPGQMNTVNVQEYFIQFEGAPKTHKRKLASVRLLIKWARLMGTLDHDPSEWIPFVEAVEESPRDLLPEEEARLRAAAEALEAEGTLLGQRDSLFLHLMLDGGLRISEAINLTINDLEKLERGKMHVFGKGAKHRNPHVRESLARRIRLWINRMPASVEGTLITTENGTALSRGEAWRRFKLIADAADVECTPHTMRHQFVMNYIAAFMQGDPLRFPAALKAASQETGDNVEVILKYYTSPRESEMRAAVEAMR
jgi:site-specific recombinase XerD